MPAPARTSCILAETRGEHGNVVGLVRFSGYVEYVIQEGGEDLTGNTPGIVVVHIKRA